MKLIAMIALGQMVSVYHAPMWELDVEAIWRPSSCQVRTPNETLYHRSSARQLTAQCLGAIWQRGGGHIHMPNEMLHRHWRVRRLTAST